MRKNIATLSLFHIDNNLLLFGIVKSVHRLKKYIRYVTEIPNNLKKN